MDNAATTQNSIVAQLPGKYKAYIFHQGAVLNENESTYAINWFDTKSQWLYDFYNFLASRSVLKVGGKPFLKCRLRHKLFGEVNSQREVLLIVQYPSLLRFKTMLESKLFLSVSIFRSLAVSDFTFGFSKRRDDAGDLAADDKSASRAPSYGVLHYSGELDSVDLRALARLGEGSELIFASEVAGTLGTGEGDSEPERLPCIMNGMAVLRSEEADSFVQLIESVQFQVLKDKSEDLFFGVYDRIF